MSSIPWPSDPRGDMTPILEASVEAAKMRHPSGEDKAPGVVLTAADRCDSCGAGAAFRVVHQVKGLDGRPDSIVNRPMQLDFCAHHWRKNFPTMADKGWVLVGGNPDAFGSKP